MLTKKRILNEVEDIMKELKHNTTTDFVRADFARFLKRNAPEYILPPEARAALSDEIPSYTILISPLVKIPSNINPIQTVLLLTRTSAKAKEEAIAVLHRFAYQEFDFNPSLLLYKLNFQSYKKQYGAITVVFIIV